jgi:transposase-like protein
VSQKKSKYSEQFRAAAVKKMEECANVTALARELGIRRKWLYQWRDEIRAAAQGRTPAGAVSDQEKEKLQRRVSELEQLVGRQAAELDFFKGALRRVEGRRQKSGSTGGAASTRRSS